MARTVFEPPCRSGATNLEPTPIALLHASVKEHRWLASAASQLILMAASGAPLWKGTELTRAPVVAPRCRCRCRVWCGTGEDGGMKRAASN
jgi:hypothetical protein